MKNLINKKENYEGVPLLTTSAMSFLLDSWLLYIAVQTQFKESKKAL